MKTSGAKYSAVLHELQRKYKGAYVAQGGEIVLNSMLYLEYWDDDNLILKSNNPLTPDRHFDNAMAMFMALGGVTNSKC